MNYIGTVVIVALILWVFGRCCFLYGRRKHDLAGFARGCQYERKLADLADPRASSRDWRGHTTN